MLTNDANIGRGRKKQIEYVSNLTENHKEDVPWTEERPSGQL
ncbi:MAG: hypothetical protein PHF18_10440 [Methanosarcina sp.]|nr:hypothetical protein [Methanosarcina sp.]MDD3247245.1 hypothetical protein [Methanosarcina sp.]MDD4248930.1 hypothetical protein [Methanosarcina sp.]